MLNPNCWNVFANLVDLFNWLVGFVAVIRLSLTVWPGKQLEFRRFPCQPVKLSRIMATKPISRMDTQLDILQWCLSAMQCSLNIRGFSICHTLTNHIYQKYFTMCFEVQFSLVICGVTRISFGYQNRGKQGTFVFGPFNAFWPLQITKSVDNQGKIRQYQFL